MADESSPSFHYRVNNYHPAAGQFLDANRLNDYKQPRRTAGHFFGLGPPAENYGRNNRFEA